MHRKSFTITVALVAGLALGIVFAPMARGSIALAQTQPPAQNQPRSGIGSLRNLFLDKLAAALNIQRSALDSAITSAGNSTVDEAVQQGSLTQAQGDALKNRLQSGDVGPLFGGHRGFRGGHELFGLKQAMFDAAAGALGITTDELRSALRNGQTVAQLAQAHNTAEQAVTSAALAAAKTQLDQAVANGSLRHGSNELDSVAIMPPTPVVACAALRAVARRRCRVGSLARPANRSAPPPDRSTVTDWRQHAHPA
ncbi:MAG TPA: hypothetical protein VLA19_14210 [Herpetosiphonaceae bacterium]|nr:hypothetical protein [Herpetosiphonaceae bacterium]